MSLYRFFILAAWLLFLYGCANITPPSGGDKDVSPPVLLSVFPADSQLHVRPSRIVLTFDEYLTVANASKEVQISPLLPVPLTVEGRYKKVTVSIPDTLLLDNTTYHISFGQAIKDLHENNPFSGYHYRFSTGAYFDTLMLSGSVIDAATGRSDSSSVILLYPASASDSVIVREKPLYITRPDASGKFVFEGLPLGPFRIYALKDANDNLVYDGSEEMVAFSDSLVYPADSLYEAVKLALFRETDTFSGKQNNTVSPETPAGSRILGERARGKEEPQSLGYTVMQVDTSDIRKRTVSITEPITIQFTKEVVKIDDTRIRLSVDSNDAERDVPLKTLLDTSGKVLKIAVDWMENAVYTLRLLKGFAADSAQAETMPSKYIFRTKWEDDYARLHVNLPSQFLGEDFLFLLMKEKDSIYQQPVRDTALHFSRLEPGKYFFRIIHDANKNGRWDTGDLLGKKQPEKVFPYRAEILLKPGWENTIDYKADPEKD